MGTTTTDNDRRTSSGASRRVAAPTHPSGRAVKEVRRHGNDND
jgi:hypothetical protein